MLRSMKPDDHVVVTLGGTTHQFGPDQTRIWVIDTTTTRSGSRYRYATITIQLDSEFPEDLSDHLTRIREGG